jgi:hypothetical protein
MGRGTVQSEGRCTQPFGGLVGSLLTASSLAAQPIPQKTPEQIKAAHDAHKADF